MRVTIVFSPHILFYWKDKKLKVVLKTKQCEHEPFFLLSCFSKIENPRANILG